MGDNYLSALEQAWRRAHFHRQKLRFQKFVTKGIDDPTPISWLVATTKRACAELTKKGNPLDALLVAVENLAYGAQTPTQFVSVFRQLEEPLTNREPSLGIADVVAKIDSLVVSDKTGQAAKTFHEVKNRLVKNHLLSSEPARKTGPFVKQACRAG